MVSVTVNDAIFTDNNHEQRERYMCPKCDYLLKNAVQVSCGHWMCQECAKDIFEERYESGSTINNYDNYIYMVYTLSNT